MKIQLEKVKTPPHFQYLCENCLDICDTVIEEVYANIDSLNPYNDYYCSDCAETIINKNKN